MTAMNENHRKEGKCFVFIGSSFEYKDSFISERQRQKTN